MLIEVQIGRISSEGSNRDAMRTTTLLVLVCLVAVGKLVLAQQSSLLEWVRYKRQNGKVYNDRTEDTRRYLLFLATKERIERHNANESNSHKLGHNHLSDWTPEEFAVLNGLHGDAPKVENNPEDEKFLQSILDNPSPVPDEVDWRKVTNRVTEIKDQGYCGSCWAFATGGALEGQQVARNFTQSLVSLSEQEIVDCSDRNKGCQGGWPNLAMLDIASFGGLESEQDYPYKISDKHPCRFNKDKVVMTDSGGIDLPENDEEALKKVVARFGPTVITLNADQFQSYKSGIFSDTTCGTNPNHAVLAVGYSNDPQHGDFWIVKNSWSTDWGENGYFRIKRGSNMCGIGKFSFIPTFR